MFRSHYDLTFISGHSDIASYWGGGNQTIFDDGVGTTLRFSELDGASVKIYDFQKDPTSRIVLYNPASTDTLILPDGHGGTMLGYIDFIGASISGSQVSVVHTLTNPSQGGLI